jgi:hypothetical protein
LEEVNKYERTIQSMRQVMEAQALENEELTKELEHFKRECEKIKNV